MTYDFLKYAKIKKDASNLSDFSLNIIQKVDRITVWFDIDIFTARVFSPIKKSFYFKQSYWCLYNTYDRGIDYSQSELKNLVKMSQVVLNSKWYSFSEGVSDRHEKHLIEKLCSSKCKKESTAHPAKFLQCFFL